MKPSVATEKRFYGALGEMVARKAKADLFFLTKFVLGADRIKSGRSKFDHHHEALCRDLMRMYQKRFDGMKQGYVVQWPRGTMKSTITTIAFPIWCLLQDPNLRILIDCENATKAERFLRVIKAFFESPLCHELFGVLYDPKKDWNNDRLCLKRTADGIKEPSIDVGGAEKDKTGNHYDIIIPDDVSGETNSRTLEQIQKVIRHVGQYLPLLDSDGLQLFAMTSWAFGDISEWVQDENEAARRDVRPEPYIINRLPAYKENAKGEFTEELEFPLLHSRATLLQALNILKPYQFSCQYLLRPMSPSTAAFRRDWIKWIGTDCLDIPIGSKPADSTIYITVDPALTQKDDSDYTAIVVAALKPDFTIYILDVQRGHWTRKEIFDQLVALNELYRPASIGMEAVFRMKDIFLYMKIQAQTNGIVLPIKTLTTTSTNKAARIMGLQPIMQAGRFYMRRKVGDFIHLEDEILKFDPRRIDAQQNDCLDATAYFVEMFNKPDEKAPGAFFERENWREEMEEQNAAKAKAGMATDKVPDQSTVRMLRAKAAKQANAGRVIPHYQHLSSVVLNS